MNDFLELDDIVDHFDRQVRTERIIPLLEALPSEEREKEIFLRSLRGEDIDVNKIRLYFEMHETQEDTHESKSNSR